MAKAAVATQGVGFEAIDRLEEKVKLLIGVIERLRGDNARATDEIARLRGELDGARTRITEAEGAGAELVALRDEREQIRGRVDDMLKQIEALNI
jgi:predicted RNase H-like nuclease (RuvC/YqgF family)